MAVKINAMPWGELNICFDYSAVTRPVFSPIWLFDATLTRQDEILTKIQPWPGSTRPGVKSHLLLPAESQLCPSHRVVHGVGDSQAQQLPANLHTPQAEGGCVQEATVPGRDGMEGVSIDRQDAAIKLLTKATSNLTGRMHGKTLPT